MRDLKRRALLSFLIAGLSFCVACAGDDDPSTSFSGQAADDDIGHEDSDDDEASDGGGAVGLDDDEDSPPPPSDDEGPDPFDDGSFAEDPTPFVSGLDDRVADYLSDCAAYGLTHGSIHAQVCVLAQDAGPVRDDAVDSTLARMIARQDTADFGLASLVRILAKYSDSPNLTQSQYDRIYDAALDFAYWIDEPGTNAMIYQTENHSMLFHSAAYVIGGLFPDEVFTNSGLTGAELRDKAARYIDLWLEKRLRFGFTEFHSNVYYNETIPGLVNVVDFGEDDDLAVRASMVIDVLLLDMALNNHEGVFGVAHGRSYMKDKQRLAAEDTKATMWLMFGKGDLLGDVASLSTVALADSDGYREPAVIESIGAARPRGLVSRESVSLDIADGPAHGVGYTDFDDIVYWWSMNGIVAPQTIETQYAVFEAWEMLVPPSPYAVFALFTPLKELGILDDLAWALYPLVSGSVIGQARTYVYRAPEVMLASAQDYHKAELTAQAHIWQATLGWDALVFTTYSGGLIDDSFAGEWTGGWNPRVAQHRTAAIVLYRKPKFEWPLVQAMVDALFPNYTHAYFPAAAFDEVVREGPWTFGRFGDGYVALYSEKPAEWRADGEWADKELFAEGRENVWICEVGDRVMYGSFAAFIDAVSSAVVTVSARQDVRYDSPGQGRMTFSWDGPLFVRGEHVSLKGYPRFDNPYIVKGFDGDDPYVVRRGALSLTLNPRTLERVVVE